MRAAVIVALLGCAAAPARADDAPLELARVMLLDGHPARALAVLEDAEVEDARELHRLRGLAEHELGLHARAVDDLRAAVRLGATGGPLCYALASAELAAGDARAALATLDRGPRELWAQAGAHRVRAAARAQLGDREGAFAAADAGAARFPADPVLLRLRALVLLELGLAEEGVEAARRALALVGDDRARLAEDYLAFTRALAGAGASARARLLLEEAVLRLPERPEVRRALARAYAAARRPWTAAELLRPLVLDDPAVALEVAELYGKAGKVDRALAANARVEDPQKKLRQRLALLIGAERYAEAAALEPHLARHGLLADEPLRYAVAYAEFVAGAAARARTLLAGLTDPELFAKAAVIRRAIDGCSSDVWRCN